MMQILTINPGSTSTKIALFANETKIFATTVVHDAAKLATYPQVWDQLDYRMETILAVCEEQKVDLDRCDAFVGRGGGLNPCRAGTYEVNDMVIRHAGRNGGYHPCALGCVIARNFADRYHARAFIVNSPDVDEYCDEAHMTGLAGLYKTFTSHVLNQKETARRVAEDLGKTYESCNLIVCHLGGGVSVAAHQNGRMLDTNGAINGEGPMAPTRSGALPAMDVIEECFSGKYTKEEMKLRITKFGGVVDHLGTSEMRDVRTMIENGNHYAALVYSTFIYQIAKEVGAMAAVLHGNVDAIVLTGGIAHDEELCQRLGEMVGFIAPIIIRPGEYEMEALCHGGLQVLLGLETPTQYDGVSVFQGFESLKPQA
ncbi:MAG: butyrate kinase [Oscillospiraceae bacterium]